MMKSDRLLSTSRSHSIMKKLLCSVFLFLLPALGLAQEVDKIACRVVCFARTKDKVEKLLIRVPEQSEVVTAFPVSHISSKIEIPVVDGKAVFYDAASKGGSPVAIASIPPEIKNALIMFFPSPSDGGPSYSTSVLDFSPKGIPEDGLVVSNVSGMDARITVGEHKIQLRPGKTVPLARPNERNEYNMARLEIQTQRNGEWRTTTQTVIKFPIGLRQLFVAYPDAGKESVSFRTYKIIGE